MSLRIEFSSRPDRTSAAKIWDGDIHLGDVLRVKGDLVLEIFPRSDQRTWMVSVAELERHLREARDALPAHADHVGALASV